MATPAAAPTPTVTKKVYGYLPNETPSIGAMLSLGLQQLLTMFPATVLVAILTKFDVGVTLLASGVGTIVALLVSGRRIPLYYGSSFSYIAVIMSVMAQFDKACFSAPYQQMPYCPSGVQLAQLGIIGTAVVEILVGLLIMRVGKASLDRVLPPIITGSVAIVIGIALASAALGMAAGTPLLLGRADVHEVAISCGYACVMVALWMIWGALHGLGIVLTRELERSTLYRERVPKLVKQLGVFAFVSFTWIFFRADSLGDALLIVQRIFTVVGQAALGKLPASRRSTRTRPPRRRRAR